MEIKITIFVQPDGFITNASTADGSFICTTSKPTLDESIASAMKFIRDRAAKIQEKINEPAN